MCRYRNDCRFPTQHWTEGKGGSKTGFREVKAGGVHARGHSRIARDQDPDAAGARTSHQGAGKGFAPARAVMAKDDAGAAGQAIERRERIGKPLLVAQK